MDYQRDRIYSLQIGQGKGKGILIENLHIEFDVVKGSDNKKKTNKANISIYNLSEENQRYCDAPFVEAVLSVGYDGLGLKRLFAGQVTLTTTRKQGADVITELSIDTLYTELNNKRVSKTASPGTTVSHVIETVVKEMVGVKRTVMTGSGVNKHFVDGYPITATPREVLNELGEAFDIEWQIDDGILYVQDAGTSYMKSTGKAIVINETSGMIERPYYDTIGKNKGKGDKLRKDRKGLKVKILLNPTLIAGSIVKLDYSTFTGYYKIEQVRHRGGIFSDAWESDLFLGSMIKT